MRLPFFKEMRIGAYILKQKLSGRKRYPLVLMLEPLFRCNLGCVGCGKIDYPDPILNRRLTVKECLDAADECGAPMVAIPGGEPLIHREIGQIVRGLVAKKKFVSLCTNALLLEKKLHLFEPSPYLFFSVHLGWLPSSGSGTALHLVMPAIALGWVFAAAHMRLTRSSMLEVLGSEYVKLARLKGLPEALVIGKHAFKNALIPVLTLAGINLVIMVNVAVVVETVFAWPGVGRLLYEGIAFRDFPVVQATVLLGGAMIVVVNLVVDILYAVIDPRIRYER